MKCLENKPASQIVVVLVNLYDLCRRGLSTYHRRSLFVIRLQIEELRLIVLSLKCI